MKVITFSKAVATGNDFVIIENKKYSTKILKSLAQKLCLRKYGIGADGLLVSQESKKADIKMRIFNSDGSEAEMCGNGIRCFILWAYRMGLIKSVSFVETIAGVIKGKVKSNAVVSVKLDASFEYKAGIKIPFKNRIFKGDYLDTGVPHFVVATDDINNVNVKSYGEFLRYHKIFKPRGTNVNFIQFANNKLYVRTYERGVEDETLACGTGCVASALILGRKNGYLAKEFTVIPKSKEKLKISYQLKNGEFKNVYLEGKADILFSAEFCFDK
ncbi:MAG: diaminopimelate epimerase [Candidatus Saelkia tenebricola]|nr:diaminopimelate epimerase [Candidatus Saelkia tenebricola]